MSEASDFRIFGTSVPGGTVNPAVTLPIVTRIGEKLRLLRQWVARLARQGIRNRHPDGTRWQRAGTFAIDADGVVRWRHLAEHAGDLPDLGAALVALGERDA